jgi:phosphoglycolate phosphatase
MLNLQGQKRLRHAAILFDLDGTIADTSSDLVAAANAALSAEGFPPSQGEALEKNVGRGAKAMLASALAANGLRADAEVMRRLFERFIAHYEANIAAATRFFPGFLEAASALREEGAKLALCTNKLERHALALLHALGAGSLFDAVAGRDTFPFCKPDPRHLTRLVESTGRHVSSALMIGDSEIDVAAAKAAQIPVIAVRFGYAFVPAESL